MKSYQQLCGIAAALDVLGDRWTLLILRDLLLGPLHYKELQENLRGITSNLLADRLRQLMDRGLIAKTGSDTRAPYALTESGRSVEPILFALGNWGFSRLNPKDHRMIRNLRWVMVSVKRRLRPIARDFVFVLESSDQGAYTIWQRCGRIHVEAGGTKGADLVLEGTALALIRATAAAHPAPWAENRQIAARGDLTLWPELLQALN